MTAYFVLRTPSGPVRFRVNPEARDDEPVLVREEDMDVGLLLFALVDAMLEYSLRTALRSEQLYNCIGLIDTDARILRLGQWRALWWG